MRRKEVEDRTQHRRVVDLGAQGVRGKTGERQEPFGTLLAFEQPPERTQCKGLRVGGG